MLKGARILSVTEKGLATQLLRVSLISSFIGKRVTIVQRLVIWGTQKLLATSPSGEVISSHHNYVTMK